VIITGCEEGVRPPRPDAVAPFYDLDLLHGPDVPEVPERHLRAAIDARKQFDYLCSRATERVIAIASPEPGVLMSRYLETVEPRGPRVPTTPQRPLTSIPQTTNDRPFRSGAIRASASSLETFQNCPLQFTIRYVLGVDTPSGVQAAVGTLVHEILERFLDPKIDGPRTKERLAEILDDMWTDDLFTYRAQAAEYRSRVTTMLLSTWFEREAAAATNVGRVEHRFEIDVAGHTLSGFIDRVDRHPAHGEGPHELEIIDYKTGSWKAGNAGEGNLQLGTYYLAAKRDPELVALGEPTRLRLHFVDAGKDAWQTIGPDHEAMWEAAIAEALRGIESEAHEPAAEAECEYCDYQRICPIQREGRLVPVAPPTRSTQ
jgi:RecB family exonuclease